MKAGIENEVPQRQTDKELDKPITQEELASAVYYLNNRPHWLTHMDSDMDTNPDTNPDRNQQTATYISRPQRTYPDRNVPIQTATDNDRTPRAKRVCDWLRDFKFNFLIYRYVEIR